MAGGTDSRQLVNFFAEWDEFSDGHKGFSLKGAIQRGCNYDFTSVGHFVAKGDGIWKELKFVNANDVEAVDVDVTK